ncbi:hypothetical protein Leryth_002403 [Lithospermum erythrorhizon]|nr:hypothetical protein Leryth_002403 [Lithospermum erythrorhizon]
MSSDKVSFKIADQSSKIMPRKVFLSPGLKIPYINNTPLALFLCDGIFYLLFKFGKVLCCSFNFLYASLSAFISAFFLFWDSSSAIFWAASAASMAALHLALSPSAIASAVSSANLAFPTLCCSSELCMYVLVHIPSSVVMTPSCYFHLNVNLKRRHQNLHLMTSSLVTVYQDYDLHLMTASLMMTMHLNYCSFREVTFLMRKLNQTSFVFLVPSCLTFESSCLVLLFAHDVAQMIYHSLKMRDHPSCCSCLDF